MKSYLNIFCCLIFCNSFAQVSNENLRSEVPVPRGEMRAAWITSVSNLDWPRPEDRNDVEAQKASLIRYYDSLVSINMNAAFLQVRSECDAFYDSPYEPWSRYLTGVQGKDPGYDPIQFAIEEAHKRGIELHAWLNPYRINASKSAGDGYYSSEHVYVEHPEWALTYDDGGKILNPGLPEVQEYIKVIVGDLINRYDLDGVHFDDYFYAYGGTPTSMDQETYDTYGAGYATIGDFRRGSINKMIANVWDTIQSVRPYIRFGVSPFGIYGNGMNPDGIIGLDAYNTIYCDPLAWLAEGTVDYITPQLYWPTGGNQDYSILLPWWADWVNTYNRHLYPGHGIYRLADDAPVARTSETASGLHELKDYFNINNTSARVQADAWTLDQIVTQVEINRQNADLGTLGSVYFRMYDFYRVNGLSSYLKEQVYFNKVLFPEMTWKTPGAPEPPSNVRLEQLPGDPFYSLAWDHSKDSIRYVIYAFDPSQPAGTETSDDNRLAITYNKHFNLPEISGYSVVVTALNRYGTESAASTIFVADQPDKVVLISPDSAAILPSSDSLVWHSAKNSSRYRLELSADESFATDFRSHILKDTVVMISDLKLEGERLYYWRVAGENISGTGIFSDTLSFTTGYPASLALLSPEDKATNVELQPELFWEASEGIDSLHIQISEGGTGFNTSTIVFDKIIPDNDTSSYKIDSTLKTLYTHYIRIRGSNEYGITAWTPVTQFKTLMPTPDPPVIIAPLNNSTEVEIPVTVTWSASEGATSYQFQVSYGEGFTNLLIDQSVYGALEYSLNDLELGTSYWSRVAARNAGGLGEWSVAITFTTQMPVTGVDGPEDGKILIYPNPGDGKVFIQGISGSAKISVTDITGKLIYPSKEIKAINNQIFLDLRGKVCQPCIIKVESSEGSGSFKVFAE
ncbi:MAG: family 10 glycosylhydrolase [Candidatus Cyclobacteriaceae bacterium M2_1C_046]